MASLLSRVQHVQGVIADRPEVLAGAPAVLESAGLAGRVQLEPADFFDAVPSNGDLYLLSRVLHDWPDDQAVQILSVCRNAMRSDARLCMLEEVAPAFTNLSQRERLDFAIKDLNMLVLVGGEERTRDEYERLLSQAGFSQMTVRSHDGCDVVQAVPA